MTLPCLPTACRCRTQGLCDGGGGCDDDDDGGDDDGGGGGGGCGGGGGDEHVGELWWDLGSVKYVWYEQGELDFRKNNWGTVFPGSTIDVYEWVGSRYLPSQWSAIAGTNEGLSQGISGQPKYSNNSVMSVKQVWDPVSNTMSNIYYYWV